MVANDIGANTMNWRRSWVMLVIAVTATAALADLFFYGHPLGWTAGCYLLLVTGFVLMRRQRWGNNPRAMLAAILCLGLVGALAEEPTRLNVVFAIAALGTLAILVRCDALLNVGQWIRRYAMLLGDPLLRPLSDSWITGRWLKRHPRSAARPLRLACLWALPILLGAIFVWLFTMANPIVENWVRLLSDQIEQLVKELADLLQADRIALWFVAGATTYALLRASRKLPPRRVTLISTPLVAPPASFIGGFPEASIVMRCLALFNLLFAVETVLDIVYLWGGRTLPQGMSHVQYAHRGAYPLIATALLAGAFVLITFRPGAPTTHRRLSRWLVYFWIVQNVLLTLSAAWRLWLLVDTSLLTRLRLATSIWLLLVASGLASLIWRIARNRDNAWLVRRNFTLAVVTLYTCCFLNLDGFIASWNAAHCDFLRHEATADSLAYFRTLGEDALPALRQLSRTLDTPQGRTAATQLGADLSAELCNELRDWRGWTWRRAHLLAVIPPDFIFPPAPPRAARPDWSDLRR